MGQKKEIRQLISEKQLQLDQHYKGGGRNALMFLIKPGPASQYGNLVDIMDEALIHDVKKYAVLPLQPAEMEFLSRRER